MKSKMKVNHHNNDDNNNSSVGRLNMIELKAYDNLQSYSRLWVMTCRVVTKRWDFQQNVSTCIKICQATGTVFWLVVISIIVRSGWYQDIYSIYIYSYLVRCYTNQICNSNSVYNKICVKTGHSTNITTKSLKKPTIHNSGVSANQSPSSACFLALNPRSQVRSCTSTWAEIRSLSFVNHASQSTAVIILVVIVIVIVILMVLS